MELAIIKYNAGNIYSVVNALKRLGITPTLTDNIEQICKADRVIFPGQGNAKEAMDYLKAHHLDTVIKELKQPLLGICVGQQLLCRHSEEGDTNCIGIFDVDVKRFQPQRHNEKVPAMGWNQLILKEHLGKKQKDNFPNTLLANLEALPYVYFVHSYYVPICQYTIAQANYILPYSAALHKDNFYATQFHPEKSGQVGEQILHNFLNISL